MALTKGFITIATGKEQYYKIAQNLLRSYRFTTKNPLPFALLCDAENEYTKEFDDVRILGEAKCNYLDKLEMYDYLPYDINIFIDADCPCFSDINRLFDIFENADDFCCYGRVLTLDDKTGWFEYQNLNDDLQKQIDYVVGLHGGIYYMRKTEKSRSVFETAKKFSKNYSEYKFKGNFESPGDEPVIALSMAVNKCKPITFNDHSIVCYWEHVNNFKLDIKNGLAIPKNIDGNYDIVHWGTRFTKTPIYLKQISTLNLLRENKNDILVALSDYKYNIIIFYNRILNFAKRICNKIKRTLKGE
jgi:hypothetical protein